MKWAIPLRALSRTLHTQVTSSANGVAPNLATTTAPPTSTPSAIELIRSQPSHYVIAFIGGKNHILTPRDLLTVPRIRDVKVGDVLLLDYIKELGSREYTIRGNPTISTSVAKVEATVVEHTKGSMEYIFKKKRRKGYQKTITHKQPYTRLRIGDIEIGPSSQTDSSQLLHDSIIFPSDLPNDN